MNIKMWIGITSLIVIYGLLMWFFIKLGIEESDWMGAVFLGIIGYIIFLVWCFS
jgi:hypothetical protein